MTRTRKYVPAPDVDIAKAENLAVQCERLAVEVRKVTQDRDMSEMADLYAETMRAYVTMLQANAVQAVHDDSEQALSDGVVI